MQLDRIDKSAFADMERFYRAHLINSLSGFKSVNLLGTVSEEGITNLAVISSVFHLGADPALMGFIMRPVTVTRDSYNNILSNGSYTLNHLNEAIYKQGHQTSARYPEEASEFDEVGLTPYYSSKLKAPYVLESQVKMGLQFLEKKEIELNGTILMIGQIEEIFVPSACISEDGYLDIEKAGSMTVSGLDAYHLTQKRSRLSYAKPDRPLKEI